MSKRLTDPDRLKSLVAAELEQTPPADPPKKKELTKLSIGALTAANIADAASTIAALKQPGTREGNPLLGDHPSVGKVLAVKGATTAAQLLVLTKLGKKHPKVANGIAKGLSAVVGAVAVSNLTKGRK